MQRSLGWLGLALALLISGPALAQNEVNWNIGVSVTTYESTDLNSLADGSNELGAAIDNTSNLDRFLAIELVLGTQSARTAGAYVAFYILPSVDGGTTYPTGADGTGQDPNQAPDCIMPLDAATTARNEVCWDIKIPPTNFKLLIANESTQAFAASGNTVKYLTYNEEVQ